MFKHTLIAPRSLVALLVFATAAAVSRPAAAQDDYTQAVGQGAQHLNAGEYEQAIEEFTAATRLNAVAPEPLIGRAAAYKELEEFEAAQRDIVEAMTLASGNPELMGRASNLRGEILVEQGAYDMALPDFQAAVDSDRDNPVYQFNLGKAFTLLGGAQQGEEALTKYLDAGVDNDEKNAEAYQLRAQAFGTIGRYDEALSDINQSLSLEPTNHESHFVKATILLRQEDYKAAADAFKAAIDNYEPEEDSDLPYVQAHLTRAAALEEAGKAAEDPAERKALYEEQRAECQRLLDALPDRNETLAAKAAALFRKGVAHRLLLAYNDAIKSLSDAIEINPALAEAYFRRGICFFHLGEERMAIRDFDQAAALDFQSPRAALWKGRTYAQLGEHYEALKSYGEALSVSDRYTDAYVNRGLTYIQLGEFDKAVDDFNEAIRLQPSDAMHYLYRGAAYRLGGEDEKAIRSLKRAIELDDTLADAYLQMALALEAFGRPDVAADYRARGEQLGQSKT